MRRFFAACAAVIVLWVTVSMLAQEPPAYFIAKLTITDQETMGEYRAGLGAVFQQFGGEVVAADGDPTVLEGEWEGLTVIIRFESRAEALAWYNSDDYQDLVRIRQSASTGDFILLDGL